MDQQPETPEARLALETGDQVVRQSHPLDRRPEHELAGVQDERFVIGDLDHLGQVRHLATDVDVRVARVREDADLEGVARVETTERAGARIERTHASQCGPPPAPYGSRRRTGSSRPDATRSPRTTPSAPARRPPHPNRSTWPPS